MRSPAPLVALLGASALALTACAGSAGPSSPSAGGALADGKTFTLSIGTDPGTLNPLVTVMSVARAIDRFLYARLVETGPDGTIVAGLAESWQSDTTGATFTLRTGTTCEDGTPITAKDVAANITYVGDPANGSPLIGLQVQPGTTAVGDDAAGTVTVTSGRPDAFLLENIGSIAIVCGNVLNDPDALAKGKGATGMFTMTEMSPNNQYTLTRRTDFTWGAGDWDPAQKGLPEKVSFRVVPNETTAVNLLLSGEITAAGVIGPDKKRLVDQGYFATNLPAPTGQLLYNQHEGRPTSDKAVRTALTQALDLDQLRTIITTGEGTKPTGLVTVSPNPCRADVVSGNLPSFDEKAAGDALDKAGWTTGSDGVRAKDGKRLELTLLSPSVLGDAGKAAAEYVQASWKKLGVALTVRSADSPAINEALFSTGDWDVSGVPLTVSMPSMLIPFYSGPTPPNGSNFAAIANTDYDTAVAAASQQAGSGGCEDWGTAEKALYENVAVVPYADQPRSTFASKAEFTESDGIDPTSIRMFE
ncbi:peptide/nickel transport system substrate-binding protein [Microbacterium resistens]|uniref:Peptide/nickel transport system substrate-binding protein n=1 Tax=Microbacterium resistens TaxID=156977 RepID=A0ABU1S9W3_9MICO|nr:ABC transporter substrate-binding protein [Microbacterium resistens]MDR6865703.1 peptide/nickel transport system substrate-binding protein [Microbacterium resistens]